MRSRILLTVLLTALFVIATGCGNVKGCPVCGTTTADGYANIDVIPVPEHNPTGEPGGPFNSFDISWVNTPTHRDYVSDRIGLAVVVVDTSQDIALFAIQGVNAVTSAGDQASPCDPTVPPTVDVFGNFTRFGCRNAPFHLNTGFGANGKFGGFPGAQCCAARANGVNPMSGPDGEEVTPDGKTLFTSIGNASVAVFDLSSMNLTTNPITPPTVLATIPTGVSGDYDGPQGISGCIASWNGEAGSAFDCGDDRADEMAYDPIHQVLAVINGDPGLPFVTFIDMSGIVARTSHCLPMVPTLPYGPYPAGFTAATGASTGTYPFPTVAGGPFAYPLQGSGTGIAGTGVSNTGALLPSPVLDPTVGGSFNPPSCIVGQVYYDGAGGIASAGVPSPPGTPGQFPLNPGVPVDVVPGPGAAGGTFPCPDPTSVHVFSGVSGGAANGPAGDPGLAGVLPAPNPVTGLPTYTIPCHHGPIVDQTLGTFCNQTAPGSNCSGAIAPAGLGGMVWNPNTGHLLLSNPNSIGITNIGSVDEIDPRLGNPNGPVVVNSFVTPNCMPTSVVQGPGNNFLVGCADHDGEAFPPNMYIINGSTGAILAEITNVGGVDEIWYNPGDNKYYVAARDMPNGPVMGVIDAATNTWLQNVTTGANSHSIAVDSSNNHAFVPLQAGGACTTQSSNGCIGVFAEQ
jgi:WD40 repeat protein